VHYGEQAGCPSGSINVKKEHFIKQQEHCKAIYAHNKDQVMSCGVMPEKCNREYNIILFLWQQKNAIPYYFFP